MMTMDKMTVDKCSRVAAVLPFGGGGVGLEQKQQEEHLTLSFQLCNEHQKPQLTEQRLQQARAPVKTCPQQAQLHAQPPGEYST